jgi:hypothetical protein
VVSNPDSFGLLPPNEGPKANKFGHRTLQVGAKFMF